MKRSLGIGLAAATLVAGLLIGYHFAPTKVVTRDVVRDRVVFREAERTEAKAEKAKDVEKGPERIVVKRRLVYVPGQSPVCEEERTTERGPVHTATKEATSASTERVVYQDREKLVMHEKLVERAAPRWGLGAAVGLGLDGSVLWGGYARARLLGPIEAGVVATKREGLLTLGVTW